MHAAGLPHQKNEKTSEPEGSRAFVERRPCVETALTLGIDGVYGLDTAS